MNANNYFEGWKYINAIFSLFQEKAEKSMKNSHIVPRYIFRGISKRFFTESEQIRALNDEIKKKAGDTKGCLHIDENSLLKYLDDKHNNREIQALSFNSNEDIKKCDDKNDEWIYNLIYKNINDKLKNTESCNDITKGKSTEIGLLKGIEKSYHYDYIKPEQIRSGTSVRLRDTEKDYTTIADYLSYTKNLISDFKTNNPTYKDYYDLEILAEMQHKGGASCLVDFSNNFLISLWFAVNDYHEDLGYLFCYDVNADAFIEDNLTYLNNVRCRQNVEDLLRSTRKITSYLVGDKHRFWLWRPSNINGRIARQDSVFVFGVERFLISKHHVEVIPIPPLWKKPILKSLKIFFGTTSDSIYPDVNGFATSNSKITPLGENTLYIRPLVKDGKVNNDLNLVQKGISCLLKGNYRIALDYLLKSRSINSSLYTKTKELKKSTNRLDLLKVKLEETYSIGLCYSKLNTPLLAIDYFEESVRLCIYLIYGIHPQKQIEIEKNDKNIKKKSIKKGANILLPKFYKIIEDYIDTIYDIKNYSQGIRFIRLLLNLSVDSGTQDVLQIVFNCLTILQYLHDNNTKDKKGILLLNKYSPISSFCGIINTHNLIIAEFIKYYDNKATLKEILENKEVANIISTFDSMIKNYSVDTTKDSSLNWIFKDIEDEMTNYFKDSDKIVRYLKELTVKVQKLQYSIQCNKKV